MFSTVYRVTQKDFYTRPYTSMWAPVVARQISKRYSSSCCGFGGLEVACWPLVPKLAGSNPAEAVGFFGAKKSSARLPSEGK